MAQSFVQKIIKTEQRFIGTTSVSGPTVIDEESPFAFDITISAQTQAIERDLIVLDVQGVPGVDADGTTYSGQFQIRRNPINGTPAITISGAGLTSTQISRIRNSVSLTEVTSPTGIGSLTSLQMSLIPIASSGARVFDITIPYDDTNIHIEPTTFVIPFLAFDGSLVNTTQFTNPIGVHVDRDNAKLIIDAGDIFTTADLISIENGSTISGARRFNYINISKQLADSFIFVDYSEDATDQAAIYIRPTGVSPITSQSDGAGYAVKISSILWRPFLNSTANPAGFRRLNLSCEYGIANGGGSVPMFTIGMFPGANAFYAPYTSGGNTFFAIDFFDTQFYTSPGVFTTVPQPGRFAIRISAHGVLFSKIAIDATARTFTIEGSVNGIPHSFVYNFTTTTIIEQAIQGMQALIDAVPAFAAGITIASGDHLRYAKCIYLNTVTYVGFSSLFESRALRITVPAINGRFEKRLVEGVGGTTLKEVFDWVVDTFGSYGLDINWNRDRVLGLDGVTQYLVGDPRNIRPWPDWENLPAIPVLFTRAGAGTSSTQTIYTSNANNPSLGAVSTPVSIYAQTNFFQSSLYEGQYVADSVASPELSFNTATTTTVEDVATAFQAIVDGSATSKFPAFVGIPSISLEFDVVSYYAAENSSYLGYHQNVHGLGGPTFPNTTPPSFSTLPGNVSFTPFGQVNEMRFGNGATSPSDDYQPITLTHNFQIPTVSGTTISELVNTNVNAAHGDLLHAELLDPIYASLDVSGLSPFSTPINVAGTIVNLSGSVLVPYIRTYPFSTNPTLTLLAQNIDRDWGPGRAGVLVTIDSGTVQHSDAIPANLLTDSQTITTGTQPHVFSGSVQVLPGVSTPTADVTLSFDITLPTTIPPTEESGIQVAIGGFERNGTFFPNTAPNQFFEPVQNSISPISFRVTDADVVYLLVRTRKTLNSSTYTSTASHYSGLATYSNGSPSYPLNPFAPTDPRFTAVWNEGGTLGVPAAVIVPVNANTIDVTIEDTTELESIHLQILNAPSSLDNFGFLAVNRTNNNKSQTKSRLGRAYGLVLDNRASWDVLISPEAILEVDRNGTLSHLGTLYSRTILNDDEGYDFTISTSLPAAIRNAVSIKPLPGNPQVWVLTLEYPVKKYLADLIAARNDENSLNGCSIDIDFLVTGRTSGVQGTARVSVFHDFTCVYDIGLCDYFWNLIDPPKPSGPEIIQNRLEIAYQTLIDCNNLTTPINNNISMNVPVLVSVGNIPTFMNGNALLLLKTLYTAEIQSFYFPTGNQLDTMEFSNCTPISLNLPLIRRLNKEFLLLPNNPDPIDDISEIQSLLQTETSYLWVRPKFYIPPTDVIKDCGENEIVVVGIGYTFKNWTNGFRQDDVIVGVGMLLPQGVFSSPEMKMCYRYYYNQDES
jgi:hypothetical protein